MTSEIDVLMYTAVFTSTGGGQYAMTLLARHLATHGSRVTLLTRPPLVRKHRYAQMLVPHQVPVIVLPYYECIWLARLGAWLAGVLLCLPYAIFKRRSLGYSWTAALSILLSRIARLERRRLRSLLDQWKSKSSKPLLHIWGPAQLTPVLLDWAQKNHVPAIYHEMGEADECYVDTWHLKPTVAALPLAQAVICCSERVAKSIRTTYDYKGPLEIIPFMTEDAVPIPERPADRVYTFGTIGRLVPHKRHEDMLLAIQRLRDEGLPARLVIAGDGPRREELEQILGELGIKDRVTFTGEFDHVSEIMAQIDALVIASSSESQSMPITEAMAYGRPVIATDFGGMPDFVQDGITGLIVPIGDHEALIAAMKRLLTNPKRSAALGENGHTRYVQLYSSDRLVHLMEQLYSHHLE